MCPQIPKIVGYTYATTLQMMKNQCCYISAVPCQTLHDQPILYCVVFLTSLQGRIMRDTTQMAKQG